MSNDMLIRLSGRILSVGEGSIEIDVSPPGETRSSSVSIPAQRGQEEWAGARIYKRVNVTIEVKGEP